MYDGPPSSGSTRKRSWLTAALVTLGVLMVLYLVLDQALAGVWTIGGRPVTARQEVGVSSLRLELALTVDPAVVPPGETTRIRFTVKDFSTRRFVSEKLDGPVLDIVAPTDYTSKDKQMPPPKVVRWSDTQPPEDPALHRLDLWPILSRTIEITYRPDPRSVNEGVEGRVWYQTRYETIGNGLIVATGLP